MNNPTKRQLAERYLISFSGGMMSDDSKIDERFLIQEINNAIALLAKNSFIENSNLDGIAYVGDQFVSTYRNVPIIKDNATGESYSLLPAIPVGLPKSRGLVMVTPPIGYQNTVKPISIREVPFLYNQPPIPGKTFYWLEGGRSSYYPRPLFDTVDMRLVSSGTADIDEPLTIPPDAIAQIYDMVKLKVAELFNIKIDNINDGEPK